MNADRAVIAAGATGNDAAPETAQRLGDSVALAMRLVGPPARGSTHNLE